jgi:hypothetical protein
MSPQRFFLPFLNIGVYPLPASILERVSAVIYFEQVLLWVYTLMSLVGSYIDPLFVHQAVANRVVALFTIPHWIPRK